MSASRSRSLASALAIALGACATRDVETRPFVIQVSPPLPPGFSYYVLPGTGRVDARRPNAFVLSGTVLVEGEPPVDLEISWQDPGGVELPRERLDGVPVTLVLLANPGGVGPDGEPLPYRGLRLATGTGAETVHQFILFEQAYRDSREHPELAPATRTNYLDITLFDPTDELPLFRVREDWAEYEPAECGPAYYDWLEVSSAEGDLFSLRHDDARQLRVGAPVEPWTVRHVVSWHRRGTCRDQAEAWTQFAAWR